MWRALVGQGNAAAICLTLCLALKQQADACFEAGDLALLVCDDIGQVLNHAGEVRDLFFKVGSVGHEAA